MIGGGPSRPHGEMAGDHQRLHKNVFYESALRIPLAFRWPGRVRPGLVSEALACTVDILPTVLEAAGADVGERCQGKTLWPLAENPDGELREAVFSEVAGPCGELMVRTREWKYAMDRSGRGWMLYNLRDDPHEQVNLVGRDDCRAVELEMRDRLLAFLAGMRPVM